MVPFQLISIDTCRGYGREPYILNNGSHTVTALVEIRPFARDGASRKKCWSTEHSRAFPYRVSSSRNRSYARAMVETGVRL